MQRINIKEEVISISDDDEIDIKREPTVSYTPPTVKSEIENEGYHDRNSFGKKPTLEDAINSFRVIQTELENCKAENAAEIIKLKAKHEKEMDASRQDFAKRFEECKKYYKNLQGYDKAKNEKEQSLLEKLNQVLQNSITEKESKIEELKNEIAKMKNESRAVQKENVNLRHRNKMLFQYGWSFYRFFEAIFERPDKNSNLPMRK